MKKYGSFQELQNATNTAGHVTVQNFYGQSGDIQGLSDVFAKLTVSVDSEIISDNGMKDRRMWEQNKERSLLLTGGITAFFKDGTEGDVQFAWDTKTAEMQVGRKRFSMSSNPADILIEAIDTGGKLPESIEKAVWEFINKHYEEIQWEKTN